MSGTGSEMNGGAVITDTRSKRKVAHIFGEEVMPRFSILDPRLTMSLPAYQLSAGIYDTFNHVCEQYFSGDDDSVSDYISEGLMRSVVNSSRTAVKDPSDYESRSNLMWAASLALNTLISRGKPTDWMVHMIGKSIGGYTGATHGMTLSAVSMAYYRFVMPYGLHRFVRFAEEVWKVDPEGKTDRRIAEEGLERMEEWMREIGVVTRVRDLGVTEDMLDELVDATTITGGGYRKLSRDDVRAILEESFREKSVLDDADGDEPCVVLQHRDVDRVDVRLGILDEDRRSEGDLEGPRADDPGFLEAGVFTYSGHVASIDMRYLFFLRDAWGEDNRRSRPFFLSTIIMKSQERYWFRSTWIR